MRLRYLLPALAFAVSPIVPPTQWAPPLTQTLYTEPFSPTLTANIGEFVPSTAGHYTFSWKVNFTGHPGDGPVWVWVQRDLTTVKVTSAKLSSKGTATLTGSVTVALPDPAYPKSQWAFTVALFVGTDGRYAGTGGTGTSTFTETYLGP